MFTAIFVPTLPFPGGSVVLFSFFFFQVIKARFKRRTFQVPYPMESSKKKVALFILRLLRTFAGVLREKIRIRAVLKENTANCVSLKSLINEDFGKKYELPVSSIPQKKNRKQPRK